MISVAFSLGHNPQLGYIRRFLFKDRVRVRASITIMERISFIMRVGIGIGLGLGLGLGIGIGL